jgi:hypothetical protein
MRTWSQRAALSLIVAHLVLLCCGGRDYAKLHIPAFGPLYPTEVVLLCAVLLSWRAVVAVPWDRLTNLVALFVAFGLFWAGVDGVGDAQGAGAKAFSFFVYSVLYFIVRGVARDDEARWRVLHGLALAAAAGALIGLVQTRMGSPLFEPSGKFEVTTTGSTRWLGGEYAVYAVIGMSVTAVGRMVGRRLPRGSALLLAGAAVELLLAQHRSGFVAFGVALFATVGFLSGSEQSLRRLLKLSMLATSALALYLLLAGGSYLNETMDRLNETTDLQDENIAWRLLCWYEVLGGIIAQPFGHGFPTWEFWFTARDPLTGCHNDYLELAYRVGVPGLAAFLALPVSMIRQTRRLVQRTGSAPQILPITVCAAMLAFLVFASFNVVLESPQVSIFFWVLLGLGAGALHDRRG